MTRIDPFNPAVVNPARQHVWMRCTEDLGPPSSEDESFLHHSALVYASDWSLGERGAASQPASQPAAAPRELSLSL